MKPKDASEDRYIIGDMVIPVTDKIETELKGDYATDNLVRYIRNNPDSIKWMEGSLLVTDFKGLDRWNDRASVAKMRVELAVMADKNDKNFARITDMLRNKRESERPSLFRRIFKFKKQ